MNIGPGHALRHKHRNPERTHKILYVREEEKTIRMVEDTRADIITTNKNVRYVSLGTRFIYFI